MYKTFISICVLNLLLPNSALAQEVFFPLKIKEDFIEKGLAMEVVYTVDYFSNTQGGTKREDTYLTNLDLTLDIDTQKIGLWNGGQIFVYLLENAGSEKLTGSIIGDLQTVSNIEAPRAIRLYELWYQHHFLEGKFSFLFGFHDYNSEFDVTEYGGLYINSSFGIQPDISAGARPSIFPLAAPGIRLKVTPHERWELLFGVYDGDPGDPDESENFPRSDFDSEGGAFIAGEAAYHFNSDGLSGFIKIGVWTNTGEFDDVVDLDESGSSIKRKNNIGPV